MYSGSALEAFLDLKNTPDPSSSSSEFSDSLRSEERVRTTWGINLES